MSIVADLLSGGSAPAVRAGAMTLTKLQLRSAVLEATRALEAAGITSDSSVLVRVAPGVAFVAYLLAVLQVGGQPFVIDHRIPATVLADSVRSSESSHEIVTTATLPATQGFSTAPAVVRRLGTATGRRTDDLIVQMSSGTTDAPRLIGRTEAAVRSEVERYREMGGIAPSGGSVVIGASVASAWGVYGGLITTLGSGLELVFPSSMTPRGLFSSVAGSDRPTVLLGGPTLATMLSSVTLGPPRQLVSVVTSGGSVTADQAEAASRALGGVPLGQVYGCTEAGLIAADLQGRTPGSVGHIAPGVTTRLGSHDDLEVAMPASPHLNPYADRGRWSDGWFRTHDAVSMDPAGTVTVLGRLDGQINLGGKKFHVTEIEHHLRQDAAVEEVVVLVDGAMIEAFVQVVPGLTWDAQRASRRLPEYMRPHAFRVAEGLPRTPSGKLLRRRDLLADREGDEDVRWP